MKGEVLIFLPGLHGGGAERVLVNYANWLVTRGQTPVLVVCERVGEYFDEVDSHVEIVNLACSRGSFALWPFYRLVQKRKPAAVLTTLTLTILLAGLVHRFSKHPFRLVIRQANTFSIDTRIAKGWKAWVKRRLAIGVWRDADARIAVSSGVAKDLAAEVGVPLDRIRVIHNSVDVDAVAALSQEEKCLSAATRLNGPYIIAIGRLASQKDYATLLRAFALIRRFRVCQLVILGTGPLREELGQLGLELGIGNDVVFPGFVANPFPVLCRAEVFVSSSMWEGFSNSLLQAMACGTPVVATDCPHGARELLEDGKYGRLTPVGDAAALAEAVLAAMNSPRNSELLREVARRYDPDRQFASYSAALQLDESQ